MWLFYASRTKLPFGFSFENLNQSTIVIGIRATVKMTLFVTAGRTDITQTVYFVAEKKI